MHDIIDINTNHHELLHWFQMQFPDLKQAMHLADHHYSEQRLNPYHVESDVWTHTMIVYKLSEIFYRDDGVVRWSSLMHDLGKPRARIVNEDNQRVMFIGHEGLSCFLAADVVNRSQLTTNEKIMIFKLIALHGSLFHFVTSDNNIKSDFYDTFMGERLTLEHLIRQVHVDSTGRFWERGRVADVALDLPSVFESAIQRTSCAVVKMRAGRPQLTVLVGPPGVGKSTYVYRNHADDVVISRDDLIMEYARNHRLNYSEAFQHFINNRDDEYNYITSKIAEQVNDARQRQAPVVIDMTNMSKKSRRRWINEFHKYDKRAVVFVAGYQELIARNKMRHELTGKYISADTLDTMCKKFSVPLYGEGFNEIIYEWQS
jgi:predicted kinase